MPGSGDAAVEVLQECRNFRNRLGPEPAVFRPHSAGGALNEGFTIPID